MSLKSWDWRYHIFFDEQLLEDVKIFMKRLEPNEEKIYEEIIRFYTSFYSFQILLDDIAEQPDQTEAFIAKAVKCIDKVIYIPATLIEYYEEKIAALSVSDEIKEKLDKILAYAQNAKLVYKEYLELCAKIYGDSFEQMKEIAVREGEQVVVLRGESVACTMRDVFEDMYAENRKDSRLTEQFGASVLSDFQVEVMPGQSFAEWWDAEIAEGDTDTLILYQNEDSQYYNDLKYTVYHETYPGHGQFYQTLSDRTEKSFDHGAISLIEGWATYAEWHAKDSEYIRAVRKNALCFLSVLISNPFEMVDEILIQNKLKQGYSRDLALQSVINATQRIGFVECYYYGALWLENHLQMKNIKPKDFLNMLKKKNVVEGFAVWNTI